jgi:hypothetical protein
MPSMSVAQSEFVLQVSSCVRILMDCVDKFLNDGVQAMTRAT